MILITEIKTLVPVKQKVWDVCVLNVLIVQNVLAPPIHYQLVALMIVLREIVMVKLIVLS